MGIFEKKALGNNEILLILQNHTYSQDLFSMGYAVYGAIISLPKDGQKISKM